MDKDEKELKSILPNLGLLGIVTEVELQFKEQYYCNLNVRVINIDKLFPKSKSKKTKGRTFSKVFEDIINSTLYNEFFWFPTTNQIYSLSLTECQDFAAPYQCMFVSMPLFFFFYFFPFFSECFSVFRHQFNLNMFWFILL